VTRAVCVRVVHALLLDGRRVEPGVLEVPAPVAAALVATPRAELVDPDADAEVVRAAVRAQNREAIGRDGVMAPRSDGRPWRPF